MRLFYLLLFILFSNISKVKFNLFYYNNDYTNKSEVEKYIQKNSTKKVENRYNITDYCVLLDSLSNEQSLQKIYNEGRFNDIISDFSKATGFKSYKVCDFGGCNYPSLSLRKSLYKINLLQWMNYFNCKKIFLLKHSSYQGQFNKEELDIIKRFMEERNLPDIHKDDDYVPIDTMILY